MRKDFVCNVSESVVKQLLDDLLHDRVMNQEEMEHIIQENKTTTDKARKIIDTVKKKGDKSSNRFIIHLQNRDPMLYECLCQSVPVPVPAGFQGEQGWPSTLIKTTKEFWINKQNPKDIYPVSVNSVKNRVALLINNITFADKTKNRYGAEKDEENMENLLKALGYEVVKYTNLTAKQMDDALVEFSKHSKLKKTDSVFVVIMSHGKLGAVLGVNYRASGEEADELSINNIYKHLNAENCPELVDKPKVIIIQACRGEELSAVAVCDDVSADQCPSSNVGADIEEDSVRYIHREKDFISLLSCTPDTVSYRHKSQGSFLIQYILKVFNTYAHEDHIEELFRKVMREFESLPRQRLKQMPTKDRCTIVRSFYIFPGLSDMD